MRQNLILDKTIRRFKVKIYLVCISLLLFVGLTGCYNSNASNFQKHTENKAVTETTGLQEQQSTSIVYSSPIALNHLKIQPIELDTEYQLINKDKKEITLYVYSDTQYDPYSYSIDIIINSHKFKTQGLDHSDLEVYLTQGNNDTYSILMCGGIGNDYKAINTYDLCLDPETVQKDTIEPVTTIYGDISSVNMEKGTFEVNDRKWVLGVSNVTAYYHIGDNGEILQDGNYKINSGSDFAGYPLIKDMKSFIYDTDLRTYKEITLKTGVKVKFYETDMKSKMYIELEDGSKGYINVVKKNDDSFYLNGIKVTDYFDKNNFWWTD